MANDPLSAQAEAINAELSAKSADLNFGWDDEGKVRALAKLALANSGETIKLDCSFTSPEGQAKMEIIGLAPLILKLLDQAAAGGIQLESGAAWTAFSKALLALRGSLR